MFIISTSLWYFLTQSLRIADGDVCRSCGVNTYLSITLQVLKLSSSVPPKSCCKGDLSDISLHASIRTQSIDVLSVRPRRSLENRRRAVSVL